MLIERAAPSVAHAAQETKIVEILEPRSPQGRVDVVYRKGVPSTFEIRVGAHGIDAPFTVPIDEQRNANVTLLD